jgi:hypothetical protein
VDVGSACCAEAGSRAAGGRAGAGARAQVDYFKSSLDAVLLDTLWNKYWVNTLAASPLLATRALGTGQLTDIGARGAARRQGPSDPGLSSSGGAAGHTPAVVNSRWKSRLGCHGVLQN